MKKHIKLYSYTNFDISIYLAISHITIQLTTKMYIFDSDKTKF